MISLNVNGKTYQLDVPLDTPLLWVMRDHLGFAGVKYGCGIGECGACTVLVDGQAERACTVSVESVLNSEIISIEGLPADHPVKKAWIDKQVPQCGYCQPGMILQAVDFLSHQKEPSEQEIADAMDDVICRCGSHPRVMTAMKLAANEMKE